MTYFEDRTFEEKVIFFRKFDILISGHDAQLTGLVFMGNSVSSKSTDNYCKQMMKFPPKSYALPYYFGSLPLQSGLSHLYLYYNNEMEDDDSDEISTTNNMNQTLKLVMKRETIAAGE